MLKEKIHRIPVVNEQQHVISKISKLLDAFQKYGDRELISEMRIQFCCGRGFT
jgi:hypothetical protein